MCKINYLWHLWLHINSLFLFLFFFLCKWPPLHSCYSPKNAATLEVTNQRLHWPNAWHAAAVGNCWHTAWKTHSLGGKCGEERAENGRENWGSRRSWKSLCMWVNQLSGRLPAIPIPFPIPNSQIGDTTTIQLSSCLMDERKMGGKVARLGGGKARYSELQRRQLQFN